MNVTSGREACLYVRMCSFAGAVPHVLLRRYGHTSIPHSNPALGNQLCSYEGGTKYAYSDFEVAIPIYGKTRYMAGASPVQVIPGTSSRLLVNDAIQEFDDPVDGRLKDNVSPSPNIGTVTTEVDLGACAQRCLDATEEEGGPCEAISFYASSSSCYIHSKLIGDDNIVNYCAIDGYDVGVEL